MARVSYVLPHSHFLQGPIMIKVRCPSCNKTLNVPDKYAGKRAKCPACQGTVLIPEILEEVVEEGIVEEVVPIKTRKPAPSRLADEDEDECIVQKPARRARPVDDEDDDRPRRKKRRKTARGDWADCPNCGCSDAIRVHWTWWGGIIGPLFINQVRCQDCGTNYNGVHGDYNTTRILIYVLVGLGLSLIIIVGGVIAGISELK
jgi:ribosomal protein S27E